MSLKKLQYFKKILLNNLPFVFLLVFFTAIYSYVSIVKHEHYQTLTWDTGFFDQLIWKLSRFKNPVSSFSGFNIFGDHFQLVLIFLTPLYWLPYSLHLLLTTQAAVAVFSSIPIYLLCTKLLKNKFLAFSICLSFLLFVPFQFAILDGFHQSVFSVLFYSCALYALFLKKSRLYWISILGLIITKEEMALLAASVGIVAFFSKEKTKGTVTFLTCIVAFFVIIKLIIPLVQGSYVHYGYGILGNTPSEILINSLKHPDLFVKNLVSPPVKLQSVLQAVLSFGFLPLFSPTLLVPAIQQFVVRFLDSVSVHRWLNLNQYSFPMAPIMAIATIFTVQKIIKKFNLKVALIAVFIMFSAILQDYIYHGPINSLFKRDFYVKKQWMRDNDEVIKYIPQHASVATTNNLGPHISQRDSLYFLSKTNTSDYLLFDLEDDRVKYSPQSYQETLEVFNKEVQSGNYEIYKNIGKSYLLKKRQ